jgi:hypothetical protein
MKAMFHPAAQTMMETSKQEQPAFAHRGKYLVDSVNDLYG